MTLVAPYGSAPPEVKTIVLRIHTLNVSFTIRQNSRKVVRVVNIWKRLTSVE